MNRVRLAVVWGPLAAVGLLFALDGLGWLGLPKVLEGRIGYLNLYTQLASLVLADRELAFRAGLLKDLAQVDDVRVVAMLAAHLDDKGAAHVAAAGLDQGLQRVRAHDAPHFGPEALQGLHAGLKHRNPKLVLAILSALTQIGDERSAAAVRRLVASTKDTQVRAAALEALPAIESSALRTALAGVLLRPASAPDADLLLRPAGMGAAQTQTLVRPSDAPGQDGDHEGMPAGQGAALRPGP